jgi:hypothetical protein
MWYVTRHPLQGCVRGPRGARELAEAGTGGRGPGCRGGADEGLPPRARPRPNKRERLLIPNCGCHRNASREAKEKSQGSLETLRAVMPF